MNLPNALVHVREQLTDAIVDNALEAEWDEANDFIVAHQCKAIAKVLTKALRPELVTARIAFLFKETMKRGERTILGKAAKASGASHFLHHHDFILTFNWTAWRALSTEQRIALVDHELTHCAFDVDRGYFIRDHDVEDFVTIVDRWGLWTRDLVDLAKVIAPQSQPDLFEGKGDPEAVAEKVIDTMIDSVIAGAAEDLRPEGDLESVTISSGRKSVTLHGDGRTEVGAGHR